MSSGKIIAQCFHCHAKRELSEKPTGALACLECGGPTSVYTSRILTPEELAKYITTTVTHKVIYKKSEGKKVSKQTEQDKNNQSSRFIPKKEDFLQRIAAGKSISAIEREWKMSQGALHYWVGKWGLKGIRPDRAKLLLDEMAIDKSEPPMPLSLPADYETQINDKQTEIVRLRGELGKALGERDSAHARIVDMERQLNEALTKRNDALSRVTELEKELAATLDTLDKAVLSNKPDHVLSTINVIENATSGMTGVQAYLTGSIITHIWRWDRNNGVEDLRKAAWCLERLIEVVEISSDEAS